jgi:arylformamidase
MTQIHDISLPIEPTMPVWPGDPKVAIRQMSSISQGDHANVSQIRMSVHTGTHIDAPRHFLADGKTVGEIPLEKLIGRALVLEISADIPLITDAVLKTHPKAGLMSEIKKVLFKTQNSRILRDSPHEFIESYVGIDPSGASFLAERGLDLIGIDYFSVAPFNQTLEPHQILLGAAIVLLEGINLLNVEEGIYHLYCLPLNIVESEGAPARAVLIENK